MISYSRRGVYRQRPQLCITSICDREEEQSKQSMGRQTARYQPRTGCQIHMHHPVRGQRHDDDQPEVIVAERLDRTGGSVERDTEPFDQAMLRRADAKSPAWRRETLRRQNSLSPLSASLACVHPEGLKFQRASRVCIVTIPGQAGASAC